jgi:hypothetical protein
MTANLHRGVLSAQAERPLCGPAINQAEGLAPISRWLSALS